jgi:hypothetical protein
MTQLIMNKNSFENKSLAQIILIAYILNLFFGWSGFYFKDFSNWQVLFYQIGSAVAISASVMAARYTGLRGQHVAAAAYILLGITHGISLAALSRAGINADRGVTMVMPMIPALIFMFWCNLFPMWLRVLGLIPCLLFAMVFIKFQSGESYFGWALYAGYATLQVIELLWGVYIYKDWQQSEVQ